ncbi:GrpB family protein [Schlesneria paludicola]|uniref:GrpB family protein n=1 Tax=Schlesneria paludicola TaxID=360056 RepID=UPI000492CC8A|nr:GrpB family protein [Schlesneria paludicola]
MPPPIKVELVAYDPRWRIVADDEKTRLTETLGPILITVHHIGSTAIPGLSAKPILDLIPVVRSVSELDQHQDALEKLGYEWWGELGLPSRRYCTKNHPDTGRRIVQLHCYAVGSPEIDRHLAFRDFLRQQPDVAQAYNAEKIRCQQLHPNDSHAYGDCKNAWIKQIESIAMGRMKPDASL